MLIVLLNEQGNAIGAAASYTEVRAHTKHIGPKFNSYAEADRLVKQLNEGLDEPGYMVAYETRVVEEFGESAPINVRIIQRPQLGQAVSSTFKGNDRQPAGVITAISPTMAVITTSTGAKFIQRGTTGVWMWGKRQLAYEGFHHP